MKILRSSPTLAISEKEIPETAGKWPSDDAYVISPGEKRQTLLGMGGAMTDSSSYVYIGLDPSEKKEFLSLCFGHDGLDYSLGRISLGSCDFSPTPYDLLNRNGEVALDNASLTVSFLKDIWGIRPLTLFASSWTPLSKWKDNADKNHGGHLLPKFIDAYADYYAKMTKSYAKAGYPISYYTPQNEPEATQTWESCRFTGIEESRLALALAKRLPDMHLLLWDHNRDALLRRLRDYVKVPGLMEATDGIAYHWYDGGRHDALYAAKSLYPNKIFIQTECCVELLNLDPNDPSSAIGHYQSFVRYYSDHVKDLNTGSAGFIDWNILLDFRGGPNHAGNYCEAPIMTDEKGHLRIMPSYYALKHLSKIVKPGSRLVETPSDSNLLSAGSISSDGKLAYTLRNNGQVERKTAFIGFDGACLYETIVAPEETVTVME